MSKKFLFKNWFLSKENSDDDYYPVELPPDPEEMERLNQQDVDRAAARPRSGSWDEPRPMTGSWETGAEVSKEEKSYWLANNPDIFFTKPGSTTFIFHIDEHGKNVMVYSTNIEQNHVDLFKMHSDIYSKLFKLKEKFDAYQVRHTGVFESRVLLGRVGIDETNRKKQTVVSFWNRSPALYQTLLAPCVKKLIEDGKITINSLVHTPKHRAISAGDIVNIKTAENNQKVTIAGKEYDINDLPGLLHTLPKMNKERQAIESAIQTDPALAQLRGRLEIPDSSKQQVRQQYQRQAQNPYLYKYGEHLR